VAAHHDLFVNGLGIVGGEPHELHLPLTLALEHAGDLPDVAVDLEGELDVRRIGELVDQRPGLALDPRGLPEQRERDRVQDRRLP